MAYVTKRPQRSPQPRYAVRRTSAHAASKGASAYAARRASACDPDLIDWSLQLMSITVEDDLGPVYTGLCDQYGDDIYREKEPIGFIHF